jgi:hypothetical protein
MKSVHFPELTLRPLQYRDLEAVQPLLAEILQDAWKPTFSSPESLGFQQYDVWRLLSARMFQHWNTAQIQVALKGNRQVGIIQVSPFNASRTTWKIDALGVAEGDGFYEVGTHLLRHCLNTLCEAHTWVVELEVNRTELLGVYRGNGFQPIAHATHWAIAPDQCQALAEKSPSLPNLLTVSNADATLLYQLDTVAMPPFVRQVLDRRVQDFRTALVSGLLKTMTQQMRHQKTVEGYIFEPQRKVAIGYFSVCLSLDGSSAHEARMTVHPAYTWLYPELLSHIAGLAQAYPTVPLHLNSTDFQTEREEYLQQIGAAPIGHTLMMSRSVWHKLRETRYTFDASPISEVLQGLQPNQTPLPGRMRGSSFQGKPPHQEPS